jgi:uncharacterized integral membrane protein
MMIRNILAALILIPLAALIVLLAVANRAAVTISLDPFIAEKPAITVTQPLFVLILATLIVGVVIGGIAAWLRQGRWRRAARVAEAEVRALRQETENLRDRLDAAEREAQRAAPALAYRRPPAA